MRKPIAFATLTPSEIEQIADSLDRETYDAVLTRICKPRSEGGYGLNISRSPLERLWAKKQVLKKINSHIESGEKLTIAKLDSFIVGEATPSDEAHDAIIAATCELAKSGDNTPAQLLTLQRLADFPARVELREQRAELDRQKFAHKLDMDAFRQHIATARLELAKGAHDLRVAKHTGGTRSPSPTSTSRDATDSTTAAEADLTPSLSQQGRGLGEGFTTTTITDSRTQEKTATSSGNAKPISTTDLKKLISDLFPSPCPLPPEIIAKNRAYAEKLRTGKIILDRSGPYVRDLELPNEPAPSPLKSDSSDLPPLPNTPCAVPATVPGSASTDY
jgi:hypothetical protein